MTEPTLIAMTPIRVPTLDGSNVYLTDNQMVALVAPLMSNIHLLEDIADPTADQTARLADLIAIARNIGSAYWDATGTTIVGATLKY